MYIKVENFKVFKLYFNKFNIKVEIFNFNLKKFILIFINLNLLNIVFIINLIIFKFYIKFVCDIMIIDNKIYIFIRKYLKLKCCKV